ncbi:MAG TPA: hypothetical protein P5165_09455 [Spirochaetia bacterium]|nr:hypothetical protein [Spirochaetales bacterium]HRY73438.1 hypothetical protein [Spirochaetia bacterium]
MTSATTSLFVLRAGPEGPLVIHPFGPGSPLYAEAEAAPEPPRFEGRFAAGPSPSSFYELRGALDAELEAGLRERALDSGFVLRVAAVSGAFLFVYLFLSIVVRDPIPLVDELAGASLAALAARSVLRRRALSSPRTAELGAALRRALGEAYFTESRLVALAESWLEEAFPALGVAAADSLGAAAFAGGGKVADGAALEAWLAAEPPALSSDDFLELGFLTELCGRELAKSGLLGPEPVAETEAAARRRLSRLDPRRRLSGRGLREAELSALFLKGRAVLERGFPDAEAKP